jgi:hypothetical protein
VPAERLLTDFGFETDPSQSAETFEARLELLRGYADIVKQRESFAQNIQPVPNALTAAIHPRLRPLLHCLPIPPLVDASEAIRHETECLPALREAQKCQRMNLVAREDQAIFTKFIRLMREAASTPVATIANWNFSTAVWDRSVRRGSDAFGRIVNRADSEFCRENSISLKDFVEIRDRIVIESLTVARIDFEQMFPHQTACAAAIFDRLVATGRITAPQ